MTFGNRWCINTLSEETFRETGRLLLCCDSYTFFHDVVSLSKLGTVSGSVCGVQSCSSVLLFTAEWIQTSFFLMFQAPLVLSATCFLLSVQKQGCIHRWGLCLCCFMLFELLTVAFYSVLRRWWDVRVHLLSDGCNYVSALKASRSVWSCWFEAFPVKLDVLVDLVEGATRGCTQKNSSHCFSCALHPVWSRMLSVRALSEEETAAERLVLLKVC